jgi:hypothetical protein
MVYTFNNKYYIVIWSLSKLLDVFKQKNQLFAASCVWLLASLIKFTDILAYYRLYHLFPSESSAEEKEEINTIAVDIQHYDISELDLNA